jgi:hypothetical protein
MNEIRSFSYDHAINEQIERQTYGITKAQINVCIEGHAGDIPEYIEAIARLAQDRLQKANDLAVDYNPDRRAEMDALRVLINRIRYAAGLEMQRGIQS